MMLVFLAGCALGAGILLVALVGALEGLESITTGRAVIPARKPTDSPGEEQK